MPIILDIDAALEAMADISQKLCDAFENGDLETAGKLIEERQHLIDSCSDFSAADLKTGKSRMLAQKLVDLDQKANKKANNLYSELKKNYVTSIRKTTSLLKYENSNYNLLSGQLIDKSR